MPESSHHSRHQPLSDDDGFEIVGVSLYPVSGPDGMSYTGTAPSRPIPNVQSITATARVSLSAADAHDLFPGGRSPNSLYAQVHVPIPTDKDIDESSAMIRDPQTGELCCYLPPRHVWADFHAPNFINPASGSDNDLSSITGIAPELHWGSKRVQVLLNHRLKMDGTVYSGTESATGSLPSPSAGGSQPLAIAPTSPSLEQTKRALPFSQGQRLKLQWPEDKHLFKRDWPKDMSGIPCQLYRKPDETAYSGSISTQNTKKDLKYSREPLRRRCVLTVGVRPESVGSDLPLMIKVTTGQMTLLPRESDPERVLTYDDKGRFTQNEKVSSSVTVIERPTGKNPKVTSEMGQITAYWDLRSKVPASVLERGPDDDGALTLERDDYYDKSSQGSGGAQANTDDPPSQA